MKLKEIKDKTEAELKKLAAELGAKRFALQFKAASKQLKNVRELRWAKKTLARVLTVINERATK